MMDDHKYVRSDRLIKEIGRKLLESWPREKIGRVASLAELESVRMVKYQAHLLNSEVDVSDFLTRWRVDVFTLDGLISDGSEGIADLSEGFAVAVSLNFHRDVGEEPEESIETEDTEEDDLDISATFFLDYSVPEGDSKSRPLSLDDLDAFGQFNAAYNVWPYWREFVQSSCARLGLEAVVIPVLRVPNFAALD